VKQNLGGYLFNKGRIPRQSNSRLSHSVLH